MSGIAAAIAALPEDQRREAISGLSEAELAALEFHWPAWARADQLPPPGDWRTWLLLGGRGSGKTRSAAEWVRDQVESGRRRCLGIIGPTADTLRRDVVQGGSGLIEISPPWNKPQHEPSQRRVVWPCGAVAHLLSSEEPERIRGPNLDGFWGDEMTSWAGAEDCWNNLQFALRIQGPKGDAPAGVISTTPKRHKLLRAVMAEPDTVVTRSRTFDNAANLDGRTLDYLQRRYGGTALGRQELDAEILDDVEGALWTRDLIERARVRVAPDLARIVVAIDPTGGGGASSDEAGIIVAGITGKGPDRRWYVLDDRSARMTPDGWARAAIAAYKEFSADRIVAERNFGGEMVAAVIANAAMGQHVPVKLVTASRGKAVRAEPVVALYEQRLVHHVGVLDGLEDQLCGWNPLEGGKSPDRLDALVWALTELSGGQAQPARLLTHSEMFRMFGERGIFGR